MKAMAFLTNPRAPQVLRANRHQRGVKTCLSVLAVASGALLSTGKVAHAFGAEDVLNGPFHHETITESAAQPTLRINVPVVPLKPIRSGRRETQATISRVASAPPLVILPDRTMRQEMNPWQFSGTFNKETSLDPDSTDALNTIGWHADYIDSYLYSPLWWAKGLPSLDRFKASLASSDELKKLHFDDLFTSEQVHYMWRRYATGTMAGLIWAAERDDVHAAQCLVGVSLHAMQDFYAHSNWVDKDTNRQKTYFQTGIVARPSLALQTGAYEKAGHLGVHHHGKIAFECSVMNQTGIKYLMSLGCSAISPLSNGPICQSYAACGRGTSLRTGVAGITTPNGVLYLAPAGIALDSTWIADIAVRERGLTGVNGIDLFNTTKGLAEEQSRQWLQTLDKMMDRLGPKHKAFWNRVRTTPASRLQRTRQYEDYAQLPYQFLSAGSYPPAPTKDEEVYLRVKLVTSRDSKAGTDGDIRLSAGNRKNVLLDYSAGRNPALNYNDFEKGDDDVYAVGPFDSVPTTLQLRNDAPNIGDVFIALGRSFVNGVKSVVDGIVGVGRSIMGTDADPIRTEHRVFSPEELATVPNEQQAPATTKTMQLPGIGSVKVTTPAGRPFSIELNGGGQGHYRLNGFILKTGESAESGPQGWRDFQVKLTTLYCVKESTWDRTSNSDEPFITALLVPLPGKTEPYRSRLTKVVKGKTENISIDTGQSVGLHHTFATVRIPKDVGYLNLPVAAWEHDDETEAARDKLMSTFAGEVDKEAVSARNGFISALGGSMASGWKLQRIEVTAWSRNGRVRVGTVLNQTVNRDIDGGDTATFNLDPNGMKTYNISAASLLPDLSPLALQRSDGTQIKDGIKLPDFGLESTKKKDSPSDAKPSGSILVPNTVPRDSSRPLPDKLRRKPRILQPRQRRALPQPRVIPMSSSGIDLSWLQPKNPAPSDCGCDS